MHTSSYPTKSYHRKPKITNIPKSNKQVCLFWTLADLKWPHHQRINTSSLLEIFSRNISISQPMTRTIVLLTDQLKLEISGSNRRSNVRKWIGERISPQSFKPTVKNCGGKIQVWEPFACSGTGHLQVVFAKNLKNKEDQGFQTVSWHSSTVSWPSDHCVVTGTLESWWCIQTKRGKHIHLVLLIFTRTCMCFSSRANLHMSP